MAVQLLTTATEILKNIYLPLFNNAISAEPTPFLELIKKEPLRGGGDIRAALRFGINGGFGMSSEGEKTPKAHAQMYKDLTTNAKDMYCDIGLSNKTLTLAREDKNAFVSAYQDEVKGAYGAAKWNIGRMLFGNGTGILGNFASALTGATEITLDNVDYLIEGLAIDIYDVNGATITKDSESPKRIKYVDKVNKKITLDAAVTTTHGGFVTVQSSYKLELTGLGAIFDTTNVPKLYGKTRANEPWLNPFTYDANHDLSSRLIYEAVAEAKYRRGANIDLIMMGNAAFRAWYEYMEETHTAITPETLAYKSGASGYKIVVGDHTATIINEPFVPTNEAWCVDKSSFKFVSTPWGFCEQHTGGAFTLVPGESYYRGLLASYGDLICDMPGGCIRIVNCDNVAPTRVTALSIVPTTKTLATADATQQITTTITPSGATNTQCKFTSSDPTVIAVSDTGLVSVVDGVTSAKNGTYLIIVSTVDGGFTGICTITLNLTE